MSRANSDTRSDKGSQNDKGLGDWISELTDRFGAERVAEMFGTAVGGVAKTKATIDKNLEAVLALANIPSRADYQKVQAKLDSLQGSIMSLSRTVEELRESLETESAPKRSTRRSTKSATTARRTTKKRP